MAVDLRNLSPSLTTDAEWRAWATGIHAQLVACGLVQTADTGQVDLSAAARPTASSYAGYRMYRFNDTLQATHPVFIKVEYGVGSPNERPGLRVQVATATNGAGGLVGNVQSASVAVLAGATKTGFAPFPSYCSGDGSRIALVTNLDVNSGAAFMSLLVERAHDADGQPTDQGFFVLTQNSLINGNWAAIPFSGTVPPNQGSWTFSTLSTGHHWQDGVDYAMLPFMYAAKGRVYLVKSMLFYEKTAVGELSTINVEHLGSVRPFVVLGDGASLAGNTCPAILWE